MNTHNPLSNVAVILGARSGPPLTPSEPSRNLAVRCRGAVQSSSRQGKYLLCCECPFSGGLAMRAVLAGRRCPFLLSVAPHPPTLMCSNAGAGGNDKNGAARRRDNAVPYWQGQGSRLISRGGDRGGWGGLPCPPHQHRLEGVGMRPRPSRSGSVQTRQRLFRAREEGLHSRRNCALFKISLP